MGGQLSYFIIYKGRPRGRPLNAVTGYKLIFQGTLKDGCNRRTFMECTF